MHHYVDRFHAALTVLAGEGHIKQRLVSAYGQNLDGISDDDFPPELKEGLRSLRDELHRVPPLPDEDAVSATVRKMSPEDASRCAEMILTLYTSLLEFRDSVQGAMPFGGDADVANQPVLVKSAGGAA